LAEKELRATKNNENNNFSTTTTTTTLPPTHRSSVANKLDEEQNKRITTLSMR